MKKLIAVLMALLMVLTLAACKNNGGKDPETSQGESASAMAESKAEESSENSTGEAETSDNGEITEETVTAQASTAPTTDPSTWTKEEIVEFYKAAAINSKSQKSIEKKTLEEMVVNDGDGGLGNLVELITPFLISALEDNSTEFDGITGGYENIVPDDIESAKAYKSGDYTVVEMKMKEQIDGAHGDPYSGTVGHSISVVGDLKVVEEALPKFEIRFDQAEVKLHYKNPQLKVKINDNGVIEKGTWSYKVYVTIENLYVGAKNFPISATVKSGYGTVDYVITVGGGF